MPNWPDAYLRVLKYFSGVIVCSGCRDRGGRDFSLSATDSRACIDATDYDDLSSQDGAFNTGVSRFVATRESFLGGMIAEIAREPLLSGGAGDKSRETQVGKSRKLR